MVESIVVILAAASLTISAGLAAVVIRLHKRSQQMQRALNELQSELDARRLQISAEDANPYSPLSGLRIAVGITQDHTVPTLSLLLKDALVSCDADVRLIESDQASSLANSWGKDQTSDQPDVLIWGSVTCNGYNEFYYKVLLNYQTPYGLLNPTSELPSQGNPQSSLVVTIVSKLKRELTVAQGRHERGRAIQELRQEGMLRQISK